MKSTCLLLSGTFINHYQIHNDFNFYCADCEHYMYRSIYIFFFSITVRILARGYDWLIFIVNASTVLNRFDLFIYFFIYLFIVLVIVTCNPNRSLKSLR